MKHLLTLITIVSLCTSITTKAQNLIADSSMETQGAWKTVLVTESTHPVNFTFNYTEDKPAAGNGTCLYISSFAPSGSGLHNFDIMLYYPLTLTPGKTYYISGAYKDITEYGVVGFWSEVMMSPYNPKDSLKNGVSYIMALNTWRGCGKGYNGTYQDGSCRYNIGDTLPNPFFHVPDSLEGEQSYYLIIETGTYNNGNWDRSIEYVIDDISVEDSATAIIEPFVLPPEIISTPVLVAETNIQLQSFPNPANETATISFALPENGDISVELCNVTGQKVATVKNEYRSGKHEIEFDTKDLPSGIYNYTLVYKGKLYSEKLMVKH